MSSISTSTTSGQSRQGQRSRRRVEPIFYFFLVPSLILFTLATAGVKGFAFTLGVGTIVSLLTAVLCTSAILGSMARSQESMPDHASST